MYINLANIDFGGEGGKKAVLQETTIESLLTETTKVVTPPEGVDGFNKVTVTHAPVETLTEATITSNGETTITPSAGFDATFGVKVVTNVMNATSPDADGVKYKYSTISSFPAGAVFAPRTGNNCEGMFEQCDSLITAPLVDISQATSIRGMFNQCTSLESIAEGFKIPEGTADIGNLFAYCRKLKSLPDGMFSSASPIKMNYCFQYCNSLTSVPLFDTSKVTDMYSVFEDCQRLTEVPLFDTSNVTHMYSLFEGSGIKTLPQFNTSKVVDMTYMVRSSEIIEFPSIDTSNVKSLSGMCYWCARLTTVPLLNTTAATAMSDIFRFCSNLTNLGGFTGLKVNLSLSDSPLLTHESLLNVINEAADVTSSPKTLTLGSTNLAKLTDEEKAIATSKGWTLA